MQVEETLSDLYALRSGLCLISNEYEESQKEQGQVKAKAAAELSLLRLSPETREAEAELAEIKKKKETAENNLKKSKDEEVLFKNAKQTHENYKINRNHSHYRMEGAQKALKHSLMIFLAFLICVPAFIFIFVFGVAEVSAMGLARMLACWCIVIIGLTIWYVVKGVVIDSDDVNGYLIVYCVVLAIIATCAFFGVFSGYFWWAILPLSIISGIIEVVITIYAGIKLNEAKEEVGTAKQKYKIYHNQHSDKVNFDKEIQQVQSVIQKLNKEIAKYSALEQEAMTRVATLQAATKQKEQQKNVTGKQECVAIHNAHRAVAMQVWEVLETTYGKLLDSRDWENLDLIIFYLETGRAESMKEALQLADRQRQNDRLVESVYQASAQIQIKLDSGFGSLQRQLDSSFQTLSIGLAKSFSYLATHIEKQTNALGSKIELQSEALLASKDAQSNDFKLLGEKLEKISSQSNLQTVLLEKSNTSSIKLLEEAKKIRQSA